jgi:hypothetical protein
MGATKIYYLRVVDSYIQSRSRWSHFSEAQQLLRSSDCDRILAVILGRSLFSSECSLALLVNEMRRVYEGMNAMILFMLTAKTTSPQTKRLTRCHAGAWETGAYPGYVGRPAACTSTPLVSEDCSINDPSIRDCWATDMARSERTAEFQLKPERSEGSRSMVGSQRREGKRDHCVNKRLLLL